MSDPKTECEAFGCRGWNHFNVATAYEGIERCDACARFADDDAATEAHDLHCRCGAAAGRSASRCHACNGPLLWREVRVVIDERICHAECAELERELADYAGALREHCDDFDVTPAIMFEEPVDFEEPEVQAEAHYCAGFLTAIARARRISPVELLEAYGQEEESDEDDHQED